MMVTLLYILMTASLASAGLIDVCDYGTNITDPAIDCADILRNNPACHEKSGNYWINCNNFTADPIEVYCDMENVPIEGAWTRLAFLNFTGGDSCPGEWISVTVEGVNYCTVASNESQAIWQISSNNCSYSEVRGHVLVDQRGETDCFDLPNTHIDQNFVDGLTFSVMDADSGIRLHLFTYAVASTRSVSNRKACECHASNFTDYPFFVQMDFMCDTGYYESGYNGFTYNATLVGPKTLFTGMDCETGGAVTYESSCCFVKSMPLFTESLYRTTNTNIEVRILSDEPHSTEMILVRELELYIR